MLKHFLFTWLFVAFGAPAHTGAVSHVVATALAFKLGFELPEVEAAPFKWGEGEEEEGEGELELE